jgi:hypothetical protein
LKYLHVDDYYGLRRQHLMERTWRGVPLKDGDEGDAQMPLTGPRRNMKVL